MLQFPSPAPVHSLPIRFIQSINQFLTHRYKHAPLLQPNATLLLYWEGTDYQPTNISNHKQYIQKNPLRKSKEITSHGR